MTTVLIADDQPLVRVGLRKIFDAERDTDVVGEAGDGREALSEARRLRPDVVLMDIRMPCGSSRGCRSHGRSRSARRSTAITYAFSSVCTVGPWVPSSTTAPSTRSPRRTRA